MRSHGLGFDALSCRLMPFWCHGRNSKCRSSFLLRVYFGTIRKGAGSISMHWTPHSLGPTSSRAGRRGVSDGGVSRSGLVLPFLSFFVLSVSFPIFWGFSRSVRGLSGHFPDLSFSFLFLSLLTGLTRNSPGPQHNPDLSRKSGKPGQGGETTRFTFSQLLLLFDPFPFSLAWSFHRQCAIQIPCCDKSTLS